jgi:o-succinylbenzoate---CoA ligase
MEIFVSPDGDRLSLRHAIEEKKARLQRAWEEGRRFLILRATGEPSSLEWILASFESPMAVVPLHPAIPAPERELALQQLPSGEWIEAENLPAPRSRKAEAKSPQEVWAVIFSSGSSGRPKGVALSGEALRGSAEAHGGLFGKHGWLLNLPLCHVGGFSVLSRAYFLQSPLALAGDRFNAETTSRWLSSGLVAGASLVPTTLHRLLEVGVSKPESLKVILLGGAPADASLLDRAKATGLPVHLTYGLTENASQAASEREPGLGMEPLPGVEIDIGAGGEVHLRSPYLATGVYEAGKLRPLALDNGYFPTGDLGRIMDGKLLVEGRKSEQIISGGVKVFPAEIESWLRGIPGLEDAALTSIPDPEWGEALCLAVVGEEYAPDTVKSSLKGKVDPRKIPRFWVRLSAIPRTPLGKVRRGELRQIVREKLGR